MTEKNNSLKKIILEPGDIHISSGPALVWTVLGSCVAIILYSNTRHKGAVCHAQLPENTHSPKKCYDYCPLPCYKETIKTNSNKYVTCSVRFMVESLAAQGIQNNELEAYIYGGASRFDIKFNGKGVGERNVEAARTILKNLNIKIKNENTGGTGGRKVEFYTETGKIRVTINKAF